ncbi:MAG TPA: ATP-binding protein [Polyangiaceae bacterium]|jgi:signal transduction histidine kinase/ActR/RegA family two-component response regulator
MPARGANPHEDRVLVYAMFGADAAHTTRLLASVGITCKACPDMADLCNSIAEGAGAVFLAEETLVPAVAHQLMDCIDQQPIWSDLPVVVSVVEREIIGAGYGLVASLGQRANITLLERPVNARAMLRAVQSALRARRRQYEMRDLVEAVAAARDLAEASSRARDEFLATLSHELRTPLNAILGWTRMLRSGMLDTPKRDRALATIERQAVAQTQLIEDLLDVSRAASGKLRVSLRSMDPSDAVQSALEAVRPAAQAKGIELLADIDVTAGPVLGDKDRLEQVMWNLLNNAIKFTPASGHVRVSLVRSERDVEIVVADDGVGISPEFLPHVFERFRQADASSTRSYGGLGIGLSIVKSVVELHGGSVTASSGGPGQGSTFCVLVPLALGVDSNRSFPAARPSSPSSLVEGAVLTGLRILVVDDDPEAIELLRDVLQSGGATVLTASSAAAGYDLLLAQHPDVLVSDIGMPEEDGITFIRRVRSVARTRIPAVAVTAYASVEDRTRVLGAGFDRHVAKPIEPREIVSVVGALVRMNGERATAP